MQTLRPRVLVLGATGMLGNAMFEFFSEDPRFEAFGTLRTNSKRKHFASHLHERLLSGIDVEKEADLITLFADIRPNLTINCVGIIKQLSAANNHLAMLSTNAVVPHRLAQICRVANSRLVHFSTDCVFSGAKGGYVERDFPDANDLYGRTKFLGEVDYPNSITLRTSIIGHELDSANSLVDWFLSQEGSVNGYRNAIFSGLPTIEIARVIRDRVLPHDNLCGLYHLSAEPINKFDLLKLIAEVYGKKIDVLPSDELVIDRSLVSNRFRQATGYQPPHWKKLIEHMYKYHQNREENNV